MSTITGIPTRIPARTIALTTERPQGYGSAEEVKNRAGVMANNHTPAERKALDRLDRVLDSRHPPRSDVPKGYYINITV